MAILEFLGRVNIADRLLTEHEYPDAKLYEVQATSTEPPAGGVTNFNDLDHLKCVFSATKDKTFGTVIIETSGWSEFAAPKFIAESWLEDIVIPWPPKEGTMAPNDAHALMVEAGYSGPFINMTFRWPLVHPEATEPKYMFTMVDGSYVIVGSITGAIETIQTSE